MMMKYNLRILLTFGPQELSIPHCYTRVALTGLHPHLTSLIHHLHLSAAIRTELSRTL